MPCWNTIAGWAAAANTQPLTLHLTEKPKQQRTARGFARGARRSHRNGHRALNFVHVKIAGCIAISDPGLLHRAQLRDLLVIERAHQTLEVLVEKVVPDHPLDAIAIRRAEIGRAFSCLGARRGDEIE